MDMPSWRIERDLDRGGTGRYVLTRETWRAEVGWSMDGDAEREVLELVLDSVAEGFDAEPVEARVEQLPGELRVHRLLRFDSTGWMAFTYIACRGSGVAVLVGTGGHPRETLQSLHDRMLTTFRCRSSALPKLTVSWPITDLPEEFGLLGDGSPSLAHRDGRWAALSRLGPEMGVEARLADPRTLRRERLRLRWG
jgi:hypothetical protein